MCWIVESEMKSYFVILHHFSAQKSCMFLKLSQYKDAVFRNSHYKDKTVSWPSYVYDKNLHTWKNVYIEMEPRS